MHEPGGSHVTGKVIRAADQRNLTTQERLSSQQPGNCPELPIAHSTVAEYLKRAEAAGISWPLPEDLSEEQLDRLLCPEEIGTDRESQKPLPEEFIGDSRDSHTFKL